MIHPSQDPRVIAGQGTIGIELFNQSPNLDLVVIPVGGGGLISGIATALKHLNPKIKIIGAEPEAVDDTKVGIDKPSILFVIHQVHRNGADPVERKASNLNHYL